MKLFTLNAHSLQGDEPRKNLERLAAFLLEERPEVVAIQEVNQPMDAPPLDPAELPGGYVPSGSARPTREGCFAAELAALLAPRAWTWLPVKISYGRYEEGLALFSLAAPIEEVRTLLLSPCDDFQNWRTRKALGVRLGGAWFWCLHMGWWDDEDPFAEQWKRLEAGLPQGPAWLLGDFNVPAHVQNQGWDLVHASGWEDSYLLAKERDGGITVQGPIDGWKDQREGLRIDYIWHRGPVETARSRTVLNGKDGPAVSDHFGVLAETEESL